MGGDFFFVAWKTVVDCFSFFEGFGAGHDSFLRDRIEQGFDVGKVLDGLYGLHRRIFATNDGDFVTGLDYLELRGCGASFHAFCAIDDTIKLISIDFAEPEDHLVLFVGGHDGLGLDLVHCFDGDRDDNQQTGTADGQ